MGHSGYNLIGQKFNRLLVIELADYRIRNYKIWICQCDCGNKTSVNTSNLVGGYIKSCGCLGREISSARMKGVFENRVIHTFWDETIYTDDYGQHKKLAITSSDRSRTKREIIGYLKCDPDDFEKYKQYNIYIGSGGYPCITLNNKPVRLHRLIMNSSKEEIVDHLRHDLLDLRKSQLRNCNHAENMQNRKSAAIHNKTGIRGVELQVNGTYRATVNFKGQRIKCGVYKDINDAAQAAANKRAELGFLDRGELPQIISVEHKNLSSKKDLL